MHRRHFFTSKASNCMPTRCSDLIANLVASWVLHTERIMGETVPTGFPSACDSVTFCRRMCRCRNYKWNTGQAKYHSDSQCQISPEKKEPKHSNHSISVGIRKRFLRKYSTNLSPSRDVFFRKVFFFGKGHAACFV